MLDVDEIKCPFRDVDEYGGVRDDAEYPLGEMHDADDNGELLRVDDADERGGDIEFGFDCWLLSPCPDSTESPFRPRNAVGEYLVAFDGSKTYPFG